jgi:hypothetical protein
MGELPMSGIKLTLSLALPVIGGLLLAVLGIVGVQNWQGEPVRIVGWFVLALGVIAMVGGLAWQ